MLPFLGNETEISLVDDTSSAADTTLGQVGPRLKRIHLQRKLTLTGLANTTGISKSTLSRLETGQRRPAGCQSEGGGGCRLKAVTAIPRAMVPTRVG